jgi:hypothetical protein
MANSDLDPDLQLSSVFDGIYDTQNGIAVFKMLIDGNWRSSESGELLDVHTPIDGSIVAKAQMATAGDVISATKAAKEKRGINELPGRERIEIFERAADGRAPGRIRACAAD